jgi:predicted MPP superfamily phosphohydrolase
MSHEPDFADAAAHSGRFDLQLSGHSHGGQVRHPLVGAPWLPKYARKYPLGGYTVDGMPLYTNRGLGMPPPRLRFRCRPEITTITLLARDS